MNEMMIFSNPEFGNVRTVTIDGDPWFVGIDVARALGYARERSAIASHVDKEDALKCGLPSNSGVQASYNPQGESIRIRLSGDLERKLIAEKNRTGKSVSQITREALAEYFRKR